MFFTQCKYAFARSRSSKVIDFGTNRKRVCDLLLVHPRNLGPILHRFRDIAGFVLDTTPVRSTLILGLFPFRWTRTPIWASPIRNLKIISREITLEVFQPK